MRHVLSILTVAAFTASTLVALVDPASAQENPEPPPGQTVVVRVVLAVVGQFPPDATFWSFLTFEPFGIRLTDPDGDGVHTAPSTPSYKATRNRSG